MAVSVDNNTSFTEVEWTFQNTSFTEVEIKKSKKKIKTLKITAMLFNFVFMPRESSIFEITVRLAQK